jgi:glycosyltransferase involved in cell wall biosynthesis
LKRGLNLLYKNFNSIPNDSLNNVPVIIPTFNQPTWCKNTIERLKDFGLTNFIILDNGSTDPHFVEWFSQTDIPVVVDKSNPGPRNFFTNMAIWNRLPEIFIVTDPDLEYPSSIPLSLVSDMIDLTEKNKWSKIAIGLNTEPSSKMYPSVKKWEKDYWNNIIDHSPYGDPVYDAKTDTTFALYNKKYVTRPGSLAWDGDFFTSPRICGNYMCNHLGWYLDKKLPQEEIDFYEGRSAWSFTLSLLKNEK